MICLASEMAMKISWIQHQMKQKDGLFTYQSPMLASPPSSYGFTTNFNEESTHSSSSSSSSGTGISPALIFIIVILVILFFVSGFLYLLVRFLTKGQSPSQSNPNLEDSTSDALQRQLHQLFHLHDSGLDQASIDALPLFSYKEVVGAKEPFDCPVCLSEFSEMDQLRLLPMCSHAFHMNCIDTWLLSSSTCPLCREDIEVVTMEKGVFPVRLGKFRKLNDLEVEIGDNTSSSSSTLDARRCYSMGSYQYVVGDAKLRVALSQDQENRAFDHVDGCTEGKKICIDTKTDSYSVSKIWLWSKKDKFASSSDAQLDNSSPPTLDLSWMHRT